tara:strand:+ start:630 stop:1481 length:852 start_codon:yes stop_codon:yes gene_type:complete
MINNLSVVLVTYKPDLIILNKCLKSINEKIKIIIVDNSSILKIDDLNENSNKNILIIHNSNVGNGEGINVGVKAANCKYVLYLDVDSEIDVNFIENIYNYAIKISDFAVIAPMLEKYEYRKKDIKNNINSEYNEMYFVEGAIMLINCENTFKKNIFFDKKIFLYWEESDFLFQCIKNKQKVYLLKNLFAKHIGNSSVKKSYIDEINLNRNWHYLWSKFYYFKKNFGIFYAYKETLRQFSSAVLKYLLYSLLRNKKNKVYKERMNGLFNSYIGRSSFRRPNIND